MHECGNKLFPSNFQHNYFRAAVGSDWRSPGTKTGRNIKMSVVDFAVSPADFEHGPGNVISVSKKTL